MEFINEEFIKTNELNETQVAAITKGGADHIATLQKDWEGKANDNAEAILHGATKAVEVLTGIVHEKGQKIADYLPLAANGYVAGTKASLERKQTELDEKIKNAGGDETLKAELIEAKQKIELLQQVEAEHEEWKKGDYKNLFEQSSKELSDTKRQVAFGKSKPKFADGVNEYEAKAKWKQFEDSINEKYEIHLDENNEPVCKDKENNFKVFKLDDLVKEDKGIQELVSGRQQLGLGAKKPSVDIEGVPFKVPENATATERQKTIKDYIIGTENIGEFSPKFAARFSELNKKILEKTPA